LLRDRTTRRGVIGPQAATTKEGVMKGLALVMAVLLVLATMLAFGVTVI
jgi:hypothetical protein